MVSAALLKDDWLACSMRSNSSTNSTSSDPRYSKRRLLCSCLKSYSLAGIRQSFLRMSPNLTEIHQKVPPAQSWMLPSRYFVVHPACFRVYTSWSFLHPCLSLRLNGPRGTSQQSGSPSSSPRTCVLEGGHQPSSNSTLGLLSAGLRTARIAGQALQV